MVRFVFLLIVVVAIVLAVVAIIRLYRKEHPKKVAPVPGAHEMLPLPPPAVDTPPVVPQDQTLGGVKGLYQFLGNVKRTERSDRRRRFSIGRDGKGFIIIVRIHAQPGRPWRYVCTPDALWGAQRPSDECVLPDNSSTADLNLLGEVQAEGLLQLLLASSPA
jgi:hypothetical protein